MLAAMKRTLQILTTLLISSNLFGQVGSNLSVQERLINHFRKYAFNDSSISKDLLYKTNFNGNNFVLSVNDNLINFDTNQTVVKNPYFLKKYEESEEEKNNVKNYPKSFTIIYKGNLISLFENGKFACFEVNSLERNLSLEKQLNSKHFYRHWIVDNKLLAHTKNQTFIWDDKKWIEFKSILFLKNQPKLFDDNEFIVFGDCHGEWGGTIYFQDKATNRVYFTESTCANTVTKNNGGYQVLSHLGHGMGFSEIKTIPDPRKLSEANPSQINNTYKGQALGYVDTSNAFTKKLDLYGIQIFSTFENSERQLFIVNVADLTFLAEIKNNRVEIVHPLFFNDLYTHNPVTTKYGEYTLVNLDHYGTGLDREISLFLIYKNKITKIDWNENHSR